MVTAGYGYFGGLSNVAYADFDAAFNISGTGLIVRVLTDPALRAGSVNPNVAPNGPRCITFYDSANNIVRIPVMELCSQRYRGDVRHIGEFNCDQYTK